MIGIQLKVTSSYSQVGSRYVQTNALHILSRIRDRGRLDGDVDPKGTTADTVVLQSEHHAYGNSDPESLSYSEPSGPRLTQP